MEQTPVGINETLELLVGVNELAVCMIELMKDGFQVADFGALMLKLQSDEMFKEKLMKAYENIGMVPAEIKDISMVEGMNLALIQIQYLPKILEAAKKPVAAPVA